MVENNDVREPSEQIAGRFVGITVFLAGIILLVLTFVMAYQAFHDPNILLPIRDFQPKAPVSSGYYFARAGLLLLLLIIMGYVSSLIAARGAQLFLSARREVRHDVASD